MKIWHEMKANAVLGSSTFVNHAIVNIMRGFGRPANFKATCDLLTHKLEETHHVTVEVHNMAIS
jgi:hypothetical protein